MQFRDRYKFDAAKDLIGKGGFAKVYRAVDTIRKRTVALKFYSGIESGKYDIISEINRMDDIVHPNLIRYYDANIISTINALGEKEELQVGILEYANSGDLSQFFKKQHPEPLVKSLILDILRGLQFLHMQDIAHRDLKPKNILLSKTKDKYVAKIADFGISKRIGTEDATVSSQLLGSVEYMAPEQFAPAVYGIDGTLDTNVDMWSVGIIMYEIFAGKLPFGSRTAGITYEHILNNILFQDLEIDYSALPKPIDEIVRRCLIKKAGDRVRQAEELIDLLLGKSPVAPAITTTKETPPRVDTNQGSETQIIDPNLNVPNKTTPPKTIEDDNSTKVIQPNITQKPLQGDAIKKPEPPKRTADSRRLNKSVLHEINVGKNLFKLGNYPGSFEILNQYTNTPEFDTESQFYLGFMYYNGKCGGAHDVELGKKMMNEAKAANRPLVLDLMVKHVLS